MASVYTCTLYNLTSLNECSKDKNEDQNYVHQLIHIAWVFCLIPVNVWGLIQLILVFVLADLIHVCITILFNWYELDAYIQPFTSIISL